MSGGALQLQFRMAIF
jgi:hypothetical protein